MAATIVCVASDAGHNFANVPRERIRLIAGLGVEGDAHLGTTVQHLSRLAKTPDLANRRQVHLIQSELFAEHAAAGHKVEFGQLGENVTTSGIDLLGLPRGSRLRSGRDAVIEITGLRNPCHQIDDNVGKGAMAATLDRDSNGNLIRKAGVMAIVLEGGEVRPGDPVEVNFMPSQYLPLEAV